MPAANRVYRDLRIERHAVLVRGGSCAGVGRMPRCLQVPETLVESGSVRRLRVRQHCRSDHSLVLVVRARHTVTPCNARAVRAPAKTGARGTSWCHERLLRWRTGHSAESWD